jgi:hypothetical protein
LPAARGFSLPKLIDSIWPSRTPSRVIIFMTDSARRCPSATLYSRLPRSSQFPSMVMRAEGFCFRYWAWASTSGRYSGLTS